MDCTKQLYNARLDLPPPSFLATDRLSAFIEFKVTTEDVTRRKLHPGSGAKKTTIKKPDYDSRQ
jgi:hypothetical protein